MITAYIQGGLGNQMFIYAAALAAAKRLDTDLQLNISSFSTDRMREYSLGLWAGVSEWADKGRPPAPVIVERQMPYDPLLAAQIRPACTLRGYFQTEKWFADIRGELRARFVPGRALTPAAKITLRQIEAEGARSAFLTVRRTDYLASDFHGVLPLSYYQEACALVAARVGDPHFFVFSDDPAWCISEFRLPHRMTVAGNFDRTVKGHLGREDSELWLMRRCRHAVMANSSYSWWGAWLGADVAGGLVVAPKRWFLKGDEDPSDIVPERWTQI